MSEQIGLTDVAAEIDLFEIEHYIDGLADFICSCKTPMTISIQGTWGTGKTSIMKMIEKKIQSDTCQCVTFNTWEFSQFNMEKDIPLVMIQSLIEALSNSNKPIGDTIKKAVGFIASITVGFLSNGADINIQELLEKGYLEQIRTLKKEFQLLINKRAGLIDNNFKLGKDEQQNEKALNIQSGNKRIIFFIDDLDRLNPEKAVELLEVLKNFLDCKNCVFILAIDYDVVWRGVAAKYGNVIGDDPKEIRKKGKDFFDKIIQVPFKMPVASYQVQNYIKKCLEEINVPINGSDIDTYHALVKESIGTNPRNLKRIMNSFALLIKVIGDQRLDELKGHKMLFATLCMQHAYEIVYNSLVESFSTLGMDHLICLAKGDYEAVTKLFPDLDVDKIDLENIQPFMQVFVEKTMDLQIDGKPDPSIVNNKMKDMKEILNMSSITAGTSVPSERKKQVEQVGRESVKHEHFSKEQVDHILSLIDRTLAGKADYAVKYVNTKDYGHAEYRYKNKKFFDVIFYDAPKGWVEIGCIPKDVSLWDEPELSMICDKREMMKGLSYWSRKGVSFKYSFNKGTSDDEEFIKIATACANDVFSE